MVCCFYIFLLPHLKYEKMNNLGGTQFTCNVGMKVLSKFRLSIGSQVTLNMDDGRSKTWTRDPKRPSRIQLQLSSWQDDAISETVDFVASTGFDGSMTIDRATAQRLKLQHVPGTVLLNSVWSSKPIVCSRVKVRIRIPELGLDEKLITAVMPVDGDKF